MVPKTGIEPARRKAKAFETSVSANSTTWAKNKINRGERDSNPRELLNSGCFRNSCFKPDSATSPKKEI